MTRALDAPPRRPCAGRTRPTRSRHNLRVGWLVASLVAACGLTGLAAATEDAADDGLPAVVYPTLPRAGVTAAAFAPAGWRVEAQSAGDLDGDGVADLAFVLHATDPRNRVASGFGDRTFDSNPRILALALGVRNGGGYRLGFENHRLIPRRVSATQDDAFEDPGSLEIRDGSVLVSLHTFSSAGGWDMGNRTLRLRRRGKGFALVGCEAANVHRASGEMRTTSVNFLTGRAWVKIGTIASEAGRVRRYSLARRAPPSVAEVGDGLDFDLLAGARAVR